MNGPSWIDELNRHGQAAVAGHLGLEPVGSQGIGPCPACGELQRGGSHRGAIGLRPDGLGWTCHQCKVKGDWAQLAALELYGQTIKAMPSECRAGLRRWASDRGLCQAGNSESAAPPIVRKVRLDTREKIAKARSTKLKPWMGEAEAGAIWNRLARVDTDPGVVAYLQGRCIDPAVVARLDLARLLPHGFEATWAKCWEREKPGPDQDARTVRVWDWAGTGHRLLVPMRAPQGGAVRGFLARCVLPDGPPVPQHVHRSRDSDGEVTEKIRATPKALMPVGFGVSRLVMAEPQAVEHNLIPTGRDPRQEPEAPGWTERESPTVLIVEGLPDYLCTAARADLRAQDAGHRAHEPIIGIISGGFGSELAAVIPQGATVRLAMDPDQGGSNFLGQAVRALHGRAHSFQVVAEPGPGRDLLVRTLQFEIQKLSEAAA